MTEHKRLVVQIRQDQWAWLQAHTGSLQPVSTVVRHLIDSAMRSGKPGSMDSARYHNHAS
jgi:hypothetical protein